MKENELGCFTADYIVFYLFIYLKSLLAVWTMLHRMTGLLANNEHERIRNTHVLHCSDYLHISHLDYVTTAIWLVSSYLIILSEHPSSDYGCASSVHNNLDSLCLKF
jgi:hypothetical protein